MDYVRHDDARGLAELAQAVSDDPRNAFCASYNALGLAVVGRHADGKAESLWACKLDPTSSLSHITRALVLNIAGDAEESLEAAARAFEVIGHHPVVLLQLPAAFRKVGDARRATR